jgi:hypothetical protein
MAKAKSPRDDSSVTPINRKPSATKQLKKSPGQNGNLQEEIRRRAYELYQQRGGEHGRDHEDWIRAEAEVLARSANRTA